MNLAGQERKNEHGYAMAVLLVGMSIMAIMLTVVMPVWKQTAQREKEAELVFRGEQYARAIGLFQKKYANAFPPNLDMLVEQRFLRKKYKDPMTNDDFVPLLQGQGTTPGTTPGSGSQTAAQPGQTPSPFQSNPATGPRPTTGATPATSGIGTPAGGPTSGINGVASKSKDKSIRLYKGRSHYNEWAFVFAPQRQAPGGASAGAPGAPGGQRGGPGGTQPPTGGFGGPGGIGGPRQPGQPGQPRQPGLPGPLGPQPGPRTLPVPGGNSPPPTNPGNPPRPPGR